MRKALTYDDVNIVPKYSELGSRSDINTSTRFTKKINLNIPIVTSPMDTVTEYDMAYEMKERGGVGVVHDVPISVRINVVSHCWLGLLRLACPCR